MNKNLRVLPREPRPQMSCRRIAPGCCGLEREIAMRTFRRENKRILHMMRKEGGANVEAYYQGDSVEVIGE